MHLTLSDAPEAGAWEAARLVAISACPVVRRAAAHLFERDDRWPANGSLWQAFFWDAAALDDRSIALRALCHEAICFAAHSARSNVQAGRREVAGGKLILHVPESAAAIPRNDQDCSSGGRAPTARTSAMAIANAA